MKNVKLIISAIVITIAAIAFLAMPVKVVSQQKALKEFSVAMPDSIYTIVKVSCMPCHSDQGKGKAKEFMNLSNWDNMKAKKQASRAKAMCNKITKGQMPPAGFLEKNPAAALSKAQKHTMCSWAKALKGK